MKMTLPKSAVIVGYKVLTQDRKSPIKPFHRSARTYYHISKGTGITVHYKKRRIMTSRLCNCPSACCEGLHFYMHKENATEHAYNFLGPLIIVLCYVPKGGNFVVRAKMARADKLVCL